MVKRGQNVNKWYTYSLNAESYFNNLIGDDPNKLQELLEENAKFVSKEMGTTLDADDCTDEGNYTYLGKEFYEYMKSKNSNNPQNIPNVIPDDDDDDEVIDLGNGSKSSFVPHISTASMYLMKRLADMEHKGFTIPYDTINGVLDVFEEGAKKYGVSNWVTAPYLDDCYQHALHHLLNVKLYGDSEDLLHCITRMMMFDHLKLNGVEFEHDESN